MCKTPKPYYEALPFALKPMHYSVSVKDISNTTYRGQVIIQLSIEEPTDELHLHHRDLTIENASATYLGASVDTKVVLVDKKKEVLVLKFDRSLDRVGQYVDVRIAFMGIIQVNMAGFYRSSYVEDGVSKYMLSTQFEATDARRAFPCLDEPALKATFTVDITTKLELTVLGNMPVAETIDLGSGEKKVTFKKTPEMSTYLLAWAIGDFDYIQGFTKSLYYDDKPLPVSIYTTKGYTEDAQFALEIAPKIVDLFSRVFQVKYPLPKLDLIAVHAFSHNAMENWGLITYRSTALLYSPKKSAPSYKQNVAYVVAHEIAHHWFGNLVTMKWWDELWLNEGFATWAGYYAVDHLFPEWDIFSEFVSSSLQQALRLDGLRNSHSIMVPVVDALDIDQLFDAISYLKGSSTILMLSASLGTDTFLEGVAKYLNTHKYGNTTARNLWAALADISGKNVSEMMDSWISKIGYPVVKVSATNGDLRLTQSRFLNGGGVLPSEDETLWWIPLNANQKGGYLKESLCLDVLSEKSIVIKFTPSGLFKLNRDTEAPFRVDYDPKILQENILDNFSLLSTKDRVGIIADIISIAISGNSSTSTITFLEMVKVLTIDANLLDDAFAPWKELITALSSFSSTFCGGSEQESNQIRSFCKSVYSKIAVRLLNEDVPATDFNRCKLKSLVLKSALGYEIPELVRYAEEKFLEWTVTERIDCSSREFVFGTVVSSERFTEKEFESMIQEVRSPSTIDSREITLGALGNISNRDFASELLAYILDEEVIPTMDAHFLAVNLTRNAKIRHDFWNFFKAKYDRLHALMSTNMVVLDRFIKLTLCNYQSPEMADEVEQFFSDKDVRGFERALKQVLDQIQINATWYDRDHQKVSDWLSKNGFY